ncbi:hypothetical protein HMSSN036_82200 [Paenibacillus macerans]|nr:hypothetical protein HMSSN036_82200 [Paenibacillus macerans]
MDRHIHPGQRRPDRRPVRGYRGRGKARATYQWLIDMTDDVDIQDGLKFLREREIVHSLRFREAVEI